MRFILLISLIFLVACEAEKPKDDPALTLEAVSFSELPSWGVDELQSFAIAFEKSCERIVRAPEAKSFAAFPEAGIYKDWQTICRGYGPINKRDNPTLKAFIEQYFQPHIASAEGEPEGLFTGYYEASLNGSRVKSDIYKYPLYERPNDLVMVDLGQFREHLKGERIAGRVVSGRLKPYESRANIVNGKWPHNDRVLVWVDDPVDAFFVQIQGSGVVQLDDGNIMRIGYAGQNGHPYYAIGRELIKRGHIEKENISMQSIRSWLAANPDQADEIMNTNKSYVFFQEQSQGATGGEGVVLTAGRSLAIDRSKIPYGMPIWVDIEQPKENVGVIRRLMIAQDTGGAIRGAVRGDVYWGFGDKAEDIAGAMKSKGRYWFLLPRTTTLSASTE